MKKIAGHEKSMDERLRCFLERHRFVLLLVGASLLALVIRCYFLPFISRDYSGFLHQWMEEIRANGGFAAIGKDIGNYTPPYLYLLCLVSYLPVYDLFLIKGISIVGDFALASAVFLLVRHFGTRLQATLAYSCTLLLPTVILNSSMWAQCDSVYTALLLFCLYFILRKRPALGCVCMGLALSFKLQAVFFLPFLVLLWLGRRVSLKHLLLIPGVYLGMLLPAGLAGRGLGILTDIFSGQSDLYRGYLAVNIPNPYYWFDTLPYETGYFLTPAFTLFGLAVLGCFVFYAWQKNAAPSDFALLSAAAVLLVLAPTVLPSMHERYYFPAILMLLVVSVLRPRQCAPLVILETVSIIAYNAFLLQRTAPIMDYNLLACFVTACAGLCVWNYHREIACARS